MAEATCPDCENPMSGCTCEEEEAAPPAGKAAAPFPPKKKAAAPAASPTAKWMGAFGK